MNSPILKYTAPYLHDGYTFQRHKALITDHEGEILDLIPLDEAGEDIKHYEGILCPGLTNAHCHLELSHLAGKIPRHAGLVDFILTLLKMRDENSMDDIIRSAERADNVMYNQGIVAVGDISNKTDTVDIKQKSPLFYHTFVEAIGFSADKAMTSIQQARKTYQAFLQRELAASIVPHAPYSISGKLFDLINDFDSEAIISIHNQESPEEDKLYLGEKSDFYRLYDTLNMNYSSFKPGGISSLKSWFPHFHGRQTILSVHNTFTEKEDISFAETGSHTICWCLCPNANLYIEGRLPPVDLWRQAKAKIVIGTDSLASNHQLSVLEELKTLQQHFPGLPTEELLRWATLNGAEALDVQARFGSFDKGKRPGIVQVAPLSEREGVPVMLGKESMASRIK